MKVELYNRHTISAATAVIAQVMYHCSINALVNYANNTLVFEMCTTVTYTLGQIPGHLS